jgi:putative pyruvate formate lyase activating enzyme
LDYIPVYLGLLQSGDLEDRIRKLNRRLSNCDLCPRKCSVNRMKGELGHCGVGKQAWVASYGPHLGEENPLRGWRGSGTIFFSGCNLSCIFCQNADISQCLSGKPTSASALAKIMLELQNQGCHNINLVSPTHVSAQITEAIHLAALSGLKLPIVYNSGGYDSVPVLKDLDGLFDIYLPDMKYSSCETARILSGVSDYPEMNRMAVLEMYRQVGDLLLDNNGIALRGLLIRHLVLPEGMAGSRSILKFIAEQVSSNTYLNIMDQYRPIFHASQIKSINRKITRGEFQDVLAEAHSQGLTRLD